MHASVRTLTQRSIARVVLLPALVVGLSLALAGTAPAQTGLQASVTDVVPKPMPCAGSAFLCGTAITNYGPADWAFVIISDAQISNTCAGYETADTFVLGDGSTLVLDENGTACQPGNALSAPGGMRSFGNPFTITGSWTVLSANGQFGSITGRGTDNLHTAGARVSATYRATP